MQRHAPTLQNHQGRLSNHAESDRSSSQGSTIGGVDFGVAGLDWPGNILGPNVLFADHSVMSEREKLITDETQVRSRGFSRSGKDELGSINKLDSIELAG
jgi:hypothetical protein